MDNKRPIARQSSPSVLSEGYHSWSNATLESEHFKMRDGSPDVTNGKEDVVYLLVKGNEQRYLIMKDNYVIAVHTVADLENVSMKFTRSLTVMLKSNRSIVVLGNAADDRYVVGVQNIQDDEELSLQCRTNPDYTYQWNVEFPKNGTSNAYFALSLTQDRNGMCYYALPSEDGTAVKLKSSASLTTYANVYVFSWDNFTPTEEVSKPSFMAIRTNQPSGGDCIGNAPTSSGENNQPPTSSGNYIQHPTSPGGGCIGPSSGDCIKNNHKVNIMVHRKDGYQCMHVNNHYVVATTSKQGDNSNSVFIWTNLNQKEGFHIKLGGSNNRMIGVKNIQDGEVLRECEDDSYHEEITVGYFENKVNSECFSLSFKSPVNDTLYYILPSLNGDLMKIHSKPTSDVYVFKIGHVDCINGKRACVFERLMKSASYSTQDSKVEETKLHGW